MRTSSLFNAISLFLALCLYVAPASAAAPKAGVEDIKHQIIRMAQSFAGQGDPDFSKQEKLDSLVKKLVRLAPQPPVKDRLHYLYGAWHQVWGPYDYRNDNRGVDPELGVDEIYQVISHDGYYYNVSPLYKDGDHAQERIGLLRGEYEQDDTYLNRLNVHFTSYRGLDYRPGTMPIWQLVPQAENDALNDEITIVPWLIVRLFFGSGALDEVYTDADIRICYGSDGTDTGMKSIYILTKVK